MSTIPLSDELAQRAADLYKEHGSEEGAARAWGIPSGTFKNRLRRARERGMVGGANTEKNQQLDSERFRARKFLETPPAILADIATNSEIGSDEIIEKIRASLRLGPKTISDISAKASLTIGQILDAIDVMRECGINIQRIGDRLDIPRSPQQSYIDGHAVEILSRPDNTFCFGAFGDLHAASKYTRWDVRADLVRRSEEAGAQAIFDTGNWIDGEASFNKYDLDAVGLEAQCKLLAGLHPKTKIPIYAIAGDDHEGWYAQREGINIGRYCESVMRAEGHNWTDLGYMEAHVLLRNANTGKAATLAVVHPGGGSSYATSYAIQKIIESLEGGEKPAVGLYGHYHKLWSGIIRNVWALQTGTQQDQTPFMRKRHLEAHVGGIPVIRLEQHPETGSIISCAPQLVKYYNRGWYSGSNRWSHHGPVVLPDRSINAE